jgi:hypothetical protein
MRKEIIQRKQNHCHMYIIQSKKTTTHAILLNHKAPKTLFLQATGNNRREKKKLFIIIMIIFRDLFSHIEDVLRA